MVGGGLLGRTRSLDDLGCRPWNRLLGCGWRALGALGDQIRENWLAKAEKDVLDEERGWPGDCWDAVLFGMTGKGV